jgi:prepilin-type N-terminal cleavage/methylation domain-containing protein
MSPRISKRASRAFTLVELLTVIAIIGVLAGILIPVVGSVRKKAGMTTSMSNLRQLGNASLIFASNNRQKLPVIDNTNNNNPYYWYRALWTIIYSEIPLPALSASTDYAAVFRDTVFLSPLMSDPETRSYGYNSYLSAFVGSAASGNPLSIPQIVNPGRTVLLTDTRTSINSGITQVVESSLYTRNDGMIFCVFVDGHVEKLNPAQVANPNPTRSEYRVPYNQSSTFWRGVSTATNGTVLTVW